MKRNPLWYKFIECDCAAEGIMLSTEDTITGNKKEDAQRQIYLAFFQNGWNGKQLSFSQKLRWTWQIWTQGIPFGDTVLLSPGKAFLLAHYLNRFVSGKWPSWGLSSDAKPRKKRKVSVAMPPDHVCLGYDEKEIENLYHAERVL